MNLSEVSIKRPVTVLMIITCIGVMGIISLKRLPLAFLPEISSSRLNISVPYRSSSPEEVNEMITIHLEDVLSSISRLERLTSTSSANNSNVALEFEDGVDMDLAAMEVRNRLDLVWAKLPADVERINIRRWQTSDMPTLNFNVSWSRSDEELYDLVEYQIIPRLQRIDGVANVDVRGMDQKKVLVELDQDLMRAHQIDAFNLLQSLRSNNQNLSAGYVFDADKKYSLRVIGEFKSLDEISRVPISGTNLFLKDVADVRFESPPKRRFQRLNGREAISFSIRKTSNANVVDVCKRIKSVLAGFGDNKRFEGLNVLIYRDQSEEILNSLNSLKYSGIIGAILAVLVLFVSLRKVRSTAIIATAIPVAIVFSFLVMYLLRLKPISSEITLNLVSMMGMVYAIGMLVDPSIVVVENIFRHKQEEGLSARNAAIVGSREVGMPILAATVTSMIVFTPLLMLEGGFMSRFMYDFGVVICAILLSSMIIAMTVVPLMASKLFVGKERQKPKDLIWLADKYSRILHWTLDHRLITVAVAVLIFFAAKYMLGQIDREFQAPTPTRRLDFRVDLPASYKISQMQGLYETVETDLLKRKEELDIRAISTNFGRGWDNRGGRSRFTVYLNEQPKTSLSSMAILDSVQKIFPQLPGVNFRLSRSHRMASGGSGLNIQLQGESLEVLNMIADEVMSRIKEVGGLKNLETSYESGQEEVQVVVNRSRVNRLGLSSQRVASSIQSALSERGVSRFKTQDREVDIEVTLREEDRTSMEKLRNLSVENQSSEMVPLYTMADMALRQAPENIRRESRRNTLSIQGDLSGRGMFTATEEISNRLANLALPPGYSWSFGQNWRSWRQSEDVSLFAIILALGLILMVMAALFESLIHPFTIITSVVFAMIGVFLIFWLTGTNLSSISYLGILVVSGLVVNNGIILVDHINQTRRHCEDRREAIIKAGKDRIRPILMTAATTNLGLLPMIIPLFLPSVFGPIEGRAGTWAPVGLAVFGGLTTSTFLTLIILPTLYSLMDDFKNSLVRIFRRV
ncbi:MAG: efflux RND transporter permease subunit [bacterium]